MCTLAANHQKSIGIEQVHLTSRTPQAQQRRISIHILKKKNRISRCYQWNWSMRHTLSMGECLKCRQIYITPYLKVNEGFIAGEVLHSHSWDLDGSEQYCPRYSGLCQALNPARLSIWCENLIDEKFQLVTAWSQIAWHLKHFLSERTCLLTSPYHQESRY